MLFRVHPKYEMIGEFDIADITFVYRIIVWHHSKYQKPLPQNCDTSPIPYQFQTIKFGENPKSS